jgi:hypothetical protein
VTSPADPADPAGGCSPALAEAVLEALRAHPAQAMTHTELAARVTARAAGDRDRGGGRATAADVVAAVRALERDGAVATARAAWSDPHLPDPVAVALADDGPDAAGRARHCLVVLERHLLRGHRCT